MGGEEKYEEGVHVANFMWACPGHTHKLTQRSYKQGHRKSGAAHKATPQTTPNHTHLFFVRKGGEREYNA